MVCQDLVRLYGRSNCKSSCMIKIDLRKAYDTIEWGFIEEMLKAFDFPQTFSDLIMACVKPLMFSLLLNGSLHGFFAPKRGLRQGDPISPLLFVLGMEYLSRIMSKVGSFPGFKYHDKCSNLKLNHLCFADDLLIFCNGDFVSILLMLRGLKLFSSSSDLLPNSEKSAIYCHGMPNAVVDRVLEVSGFSRSHLPFRAAGGLGFRRIHDWNLAAMGKYVWAIAKKKDNLFVKWINSVYLLNQNWWDYKCPTDCSWYWKRLVAVKDSFKAKISHDSFLSQIYNIKLGLNLLFPQESRVPWRKFVWDRFITPNH
ncbi:uncharacterized protein LOC133814064 [Humulus lupulus]|uniref:uncharacterized protein LOC133814064 n=1 Tax=Humulus lupulus TaxID=3486 RepID=UPI002B40707F|nr:uncharacterized protein LOC133814064 [Humulus lupulus]